MTSEFWDWLMLSDQGLLVRIGQGCAILAFLALWEIRSRGLRHSRRWREYLFLVSVVALTMAYGIINDQITCAISWEYFYYHDESMSQALGPLSNGQAPPPWALHVEAIRMAAKATWTAGLVVGVAMLIANNPRKRPPVLPQLPYRRLYRLLLTPLLVAVGLSIVLGVAGYLRAFELYGAFERYVKEMAIIARLRPYETAWGVHLGAYAGGLIGLIAAIVLVRRGRKKLAASLAQ